MKLFGSNETKINGIVASWEFVRGVEVFPSSKRLRRYSSSILQPEVSAFGARARSSPSSVDRRSLSFSQFPPLCSRADAILDFRWRESPSSSSGSAESNASDRALLDLDMVGNVKNVTVPPFEIFAKKISNLVSN